MRRELFNVSATVCLYSLTLTPLLTSTSPVLTTLDFDYGPIRHLPRALDPLHHEFGLSNGLERLL